MKADDLVWQFHSIPESGAVPWALLTGALGTHTLKPGLWEKHRLDLAQAMEGVLSASGVHRTDEGLLEVAVSYNGTWMTRRHRSHVGVGFVMDVERGFVLDFEVVSNFCQECHKKEQALSPAEFSHWKAHCQVCKEFQREKWCYGGRGCSSLVATF